METTTDIRWDLARMSELANSLESRGKSVLELRGTALAASESAHTTLETRLAVLAAEWTLRAADAIRRRRILLAVAENSLAEELARIVTVEPAGWRPELQSRPPDVVELEMAAALAAGAESEAARLTLELVLAKRNELLMSPLPDLGMVVQLQRLADYLAYELARTQPGPAPDWKAAREQAAAIAALLDESWLRDVSRQDLLAIHRLVLDLDSSELDAVIMLLEDAHLYRWLRELDGIAGGNLSSEEERSLFQAIAAKAGAATLYRIAAAERGGKFAEVAVAVFAASPTPVAIEFIEICAAHAMDSDAALAATLGGLAALEPAARIVAYTALLQTGSTDILVTAARSFIDREIIDRDDPVIVEFLEGVAASLTSTAEALWDLTGSLVLDSHRFREAWASLGGTISLLGQDPLAFVAVVLDLDTLRRNPARWLGAATADVAAFGVGRLARLGRLGTAARAVAERVRTISSRSVIIDGIEIEAGHLAVTVERLHGAGDALEIRAVLEHQEDVDALTRRLEELPSRLPHLELAAALSLVRLLGATANALVDNIAAATQIAPVSG